MYVLQELLLMIGRLACADILGSTNYRVEIADQCQVIETSSSYIPELNIQITNGTSRKPFGSVLLVNGSCSQYGYVSYFVTCTTGMF